MKRASKRAERVCPLIKRGNLKFEFVVQQDTAGKIKRVKTTGGEF
jgi:hypothetical protein